MAKPIPIPPAHLVQMVDRVKWQELRMHGAEKLQLFASAVPCYA